MVADQYATLSQLMAIVSILGSAVTPRAKFMQTMFFNIVAVCLAALVGLLASYASVKARRVSMSVLKGGTGPKNDSSANNTYNSLASTVSGILLFAQIWLIHFIRARFPRLQSPAILYAIFADLLSTSTPVFLDLKAANVKVKELMICFLSGLAITTFTSLFIYPTTCRSAVCHMISEYTSELHTFLQYFVTVEESGSHRYRFELHTHGDGMRNSKRKVPNFSSAARRIKNVHARLVSELAFATKEIGLGKMCADDLNAISHHLHEIMIPVIGLNFAFGVTEFDYGNQNINSHDDFADQDPPFAAQNEEFDERRAFLKWFAEDIGDSFVDLVNLIETGLKESTLILECGKEPRMDQKLLTEIESRRDRITEPTQLHPFQSSTNFSLHFKQRLADLSAINSAALEKCIQDIESQLPISVGEESWTSHTNVVGFVEGPANKQPHWRHVESFLYVCATKNNVAAD